MWTQAYSGNVTVSTPNDAGFTTTVQAKKGVASFRGLSLSATGERRIDPGSRERPERAR